METGDIFLPPMSRLAKESNIICYLCVVIYAKNDNITGEQFKYQI